MFYLFPAVLAGSLLLGIIYIWRDLAARRAYTRAMLANNCKRARKYPHKDPILGLDFVRKVRKSMVEGNAWLREKQEFALYGKTFETHLMGETILYTMDYKNIQTIMALEFDKFGVAPLRTITSDMMGNGIFITDGPVWAHARKTLRPVFHKSQIEDFVTFDKHISRLIRRIPRDGSVVDLQKLIQSMFMDISMEYLFGEIIPPDSDSSSPRANEFVTCFDKTWTCFATRNRGGISMPFHKWRSEREWKARIQELRSFVDKYIDDALERKEKVLKTTNAALASENSFIFIDQLVYLTEDRAFIRDQLLNVFFPARESAGSGASLMFFTLARHPDVWRKLRHEILDIEEPITRTSLRSSRYLNHVVNECLRLLAPANRVRRTCLKDCILPYGGGPDGKSPLLVTSGTHIDANFGLVHRDKDIWGDDADDFLPQRWDIVDSNTKYLPFFGGPRICPAKEMVVTQFSYLLVKMAREFKRIENKDDVGMLVEEHRFTVSSRNGVKVVLVPQ